MKELKHPTKLIDMSCYQFALYGGLDAKTLHSIGNRFNEFGNYLLLNNNFPNIMQNITAVDVPNNIVGEGALNDAQKTTVMQLLCKEFQLEIGNQTSSTFLYGLFRENQKLPEHMWNTYGKDIYDTMPGQPIRTQVNDRGLNPPSEEDLLRNNEVTKIPIKSLTDGQLVILNSTSWK